MSISSQFILFYQVQISTNYKKTIFKSFVLSLVLARTGIIFVISSPGPKVQVNYCHHLASVVCRLVNFSHFKLHLRKPLGRLEPNLAGMFLEWFSTKLLFFVLVGYSIWLPGPIMCSDWLKFQRSSSLKLTN